MAALITRGEQMLALRRRREAASPPILRGGFRPFFFAGPLWAVAALALWVLALSGTLVLPTAFDPLAWHRHEMIFGFVGAAIAGFLLTAIPNWTGRLPIAGAPLASIVGLWLAARLALLFSGTVGPLVAALLDVGFYFVLAAVAAREVLQAKNRNLPVVGLVAMFGIANALDHAAASNLLAATDLGWMLALSIVVLMISVIGGRIIPSFTRNWMAKRGMTARLPTQPGRFDLAVIAFTAIALLTWLTPAPPRLTALLLGAAGIMQLLRLARWRGIHTFADPLVFILHVGYAWVPTGLLLLAASTAGTWVPRSAAIHALTAGAMTTMILAVMTRASLGHTARELRANGPTVLIYAFVTSGALVRVLAALQLLPYSPWMDVSALLVAGALLLFAIAYAPVLWGPRLSERGR